MTDGIGRIIGGGNNYGVGGYLSKRKEEPPQDDLPTVVTNQDRPTVDPDSVMNFMNANTFVQPVLSVNPVKLDPDVVARISNSMANFEVVYRVAEEEFGDLAPLILDMM